MELINLWKLIIPNHKFTTNNTRPRFERLKLRREFEIDQFSRFTVLKPASAITPIILKFSMNLKLTNHVGIVSSN